MLPMCDLNQSFCSHFYQWCQSFWGWLYIEDANSWRPISRTVTVGGLFFLDFQAHDRGLHPKGSINCAGYKVLISMEKYLELLDTSLPGKTVRDLSNNSWGRGENVVFYVYTCSDFLSNVAISAQAQVGKLMAYSGWEPLLVTKVEWLEWSKLKIHVGVNSG